MQQETLERYQVLVYLAAILGGLGVGVVLPGQIGLLESALWPLLAVLLYTTFTQVPLAHLHTAFSDGRFLSAAVMGNFVLLPLALALPSSFELAVVVIVFQSLVELLGMVVYLWWVLRKLFPSGVV